MRRMIDCFVMDVRQRVYRTDRARVSRQWKELGRSHSAETVLRFRTVLADTVGATPVISQSLVWASVNP